MKLLSRQNVLSKFNLYFLAFTTEMPPLSDLEAVGNQLFLVLNLNS